MAEYLEAAGLRYQLLVDLPKGSSRRNPFRQLMRIVKNAHALREMSPDLVVIVQGNILLSSGGILSCLFGKLNFCSYIPMSFQPVGIGDQLLRRVAILLAPILYKLVPSFITIDQTQAAKIQRENHRASIYIAENYVPPVQINGDKAEARARLGVAPGRKVLTLIGRIEFAHKCQDWVIREFKEDPFLDDKFVLIVGRGSDSQQLEALLTPDLAERFRFLPWKGDLFEVFSATDALLIPSRNEGVPLVMLEALSCGIPVVGSDQDGMHSWLPSQWRYPWGNKEEFRRAVDAALSEPAAGVWNELSARLKCAHDEDRFASQFSHALWCCCASRCVNGVSDPV